MKQKENVYIQILEYRLTFIISNTAAPLAHPYYRIV